MPPLVVAQAVQAPPPSLADNTADADRLRRVLDRCFGRPVSLSLAVIGPVAAAFRRAGFQGYAVCNLLGDRIEVVDFAASQPRLAGMALDLGTTHLAAELVDLTDGTVLARAGRPNSQAAWGADILSRIHHAAVGGMDLQRAVLADIDALAGELARQAAVDIGEIRALTVAGNTTMVHLLLGLDPRLICREPYIPVANRFEPFAAADLGLALHPRVPVLVLPNVGSYFGGDLVAGILATGLDQGAATAMLIDVGTNAEVVIGNRDFLVACAGAAGPALEGGIARMGMRAEAGAVERVHIDPASGRVTYRTIGGVAPRGICGSGVIDLVAALYLAEIVDFRGKLRPGSHPAVVEVEGRPAFLLASAEETADHRPLLFDQVDLDNAIRSKAAMYAILTTLVGEVGVDFAEVQRIFVAGAFGQHIDPRSAVVIGMLPDLDPAVFQVVGNSALAGARLLLLDGEQYRRAEDTASRITYLELNVNHAFMNRFSGARCLPHTDPERFPSVPRLGR